MKIEDIPAYPETLTFVPLEADSINVFAFLAVFPNGARLAVSATYPQGAVDLKHAQEFATKLVEKLLMSRDEASVRGTNWASASAAIQRLILDFNDRRNAALLASMRAPTETLQ